MGLAAVAVPRDSRWTLFGIGLRVVDKGFVGGRKSHSICARRSPTENLKDAGSIPATSTKTYRTTEAIMDLFEALGFTWDRTEFPKTVPAHSVERACFRFHKMLPEFVWDAAMLEGNPFTFPEVQTLLDGITVGGHKLSDQEQILNLAESSRELLTLVKTQRFKLDKSTFCELHGIVARNEALEWGHFRGEGHETNYTPDVGLGERGRYTPPPTLLGASELNRLFASGVAALEESRISALEKGLVFFLFGALQQFFFDGNKRTSRLMMNGILMSHGIDAISIPAAQAQSFNEKMVRFYLTKDASEMIGFLMDCHPELTVLPDEGSRE